ncbi:MAG: hypothetical protein V5804_15180 [Mucilaginibacter sp.]|uniref:hypothetical protein n=1 Tax=Mucilaginibacter sp. TaxID=1882438 RepID=UPI0034E4D0FC
MEQFRDKVLFPEKLAKAQEILSKGGLPTRKNKTTANKGIANSVDGQPVQIFHRD